MSMPKLPNFTLAALLLCGAAALHAATVTNTLVHDAFAAPAVNAGLLLDANGYRAPTSSQAVWYGGGAAIVYTQGASVGMSAGNRGLMAYFAPSTSLATLAIGETLTATVTFSFIDGTGASSAGDFRMGLLDSGGNGTATNNGANPDATPPESPAAARIVSDNFSLTSGGNTPRGYSGYVVDTTASPTPSTNSLSFWRRDGAPLHSQQWLGPTSSDLAANSTFTQLLPGAGGGPAGAIKNDGTSYVATYSVTAVSATTVTLSYTVTSGSTTVMSYSVTETSDSPHLGFDTFMILSTYNAKLSVTDFLISQTSVLPAIVTPPAPQTVAAGADATFTVVATGAPAPTYQWQKNGTDIAGATAATLTLPAVQTADAGDYRVIISNSAGNVTSAAAPLTVLTVPEITSQPVGAEIFEGQNATIAAGVRGAPPLTYQWQQDGVAVSDGGSLSGATTGTLTVTAAQLANAGAYTLVVSNSYGSVTTEPATLAVYTATPPSITTQPASQSVFEGVTTSFSVGVDGPPPFTFQWMKDGVALTDDGRISGSATATLAIGSTNLSDAGGYSVTVSNFADSVSSASATLTVSASPTPLAPTATAARNIAETSFSARWNAAANATGYKLDVATDSAFGSFVSGYEDVDAGATFAWNVSGLTLGSTYYYRVRAYNSSGTSGNSNVISVTVQTPVAPAITSGSGTIFTVGVPGSFTFTATGSPPPTFTAAGLPGWAQLDPTTGVLSGLAPAGTEGAQFSLTVTAQNDKLPNATQLFMLAVQAVPSVSEPLTITTLAGQAGAPGSADGTGPAARFNLLSGLAVDTAGNVYVADMGNHTIRKVTAAGVVTTLAGHAGTAGHADGSGSAASFDSPSGVAVDGAGNTYVADTLNHTIRKITSAGAVTTLAGQAGASGSADGVAGAARFFAPQGLALSPAGATLYVADTNNDTVRRIDLATGTVSTLAGAAGQSGSANGVGAAARFNGPSAVAVDANGNLYVADMDNGTLRSVTAAGAVTTIAGLAGSAGAADGTGSAARFNHPAAVAVDSAFNVYVLDTDNHTVRKVVSALGVVTTIAGQAGTAGSADGVGSAARFTYPAGITVDASGGIYIADTNNHTLRTAAVPNAPVIVTQPQGMSALVGSTVQFSVKATGRPAPSYQWFLGTSPIAGGTGDTLSLASVQAANAGDYTVQVSNSVGQVTSNRATLVINPVPVTPVSIDSAGGGAPGVWFYLALVLLGASRWAVRRRSRRSSGC